MTVARQPQELDRLPRAVALGTFDGVHLGHQRVLRGAVDAGLTPTVVTFEPHPRAALGYRVDLLTTLERRLELLAAAGIADVLVIEFTLDVARLAPGAFAERVLTPIGTEVVITGPDFRFGHARRGDVDTLAGLGFDVRPVPLVEGVSSTLVRQLLHAGEVERAARLLGRPAEVDGVVVAGDARGGTLGFPTANVQVAADLVVPPHGIYAGTAGGHRAAVSIGVNPHYGGVERRIEAFLLDFSGSLYGQRLVVELWQRLRDEQAFDSEQALVEQITRDVDAARAAVPPV